MKHRSFAVAVLVAGAGVVWAATTLQAQEAPVGPRLIAAPGGVSLVVARPTRVVPPKTTQMQVAAGRFQPLGAAAKLALVAAAGFPAPPAGSDQPFTLSMKTPFAEGKGYLYLWNASSANASGAYVGFGSDGMVDFRSFQLSAKLFMIHYQVQAMSGVTKYKVYIWFDGTTIETPAKPLNTTQDIVVLLAVPAGATWDPATRAMTSLTADGFWTLRGVEVTPM